MSFLSPHTGAGADGPYRPVPSGLLPDMATAVQGAIQLATPPDRADVRFAYGEIPVTGAIVRDGAGYVLSIEAVAGIVPYSAEDRDARSVLLSGVREVARLHENEITVAVDRHQAIVVGARRPLPPPLTAVNVLAALVTLMVEARPAFEDLAAYLPELGAALPPRIAARSYTAA